jgi:hypothetical protein
MVLRHHLRRGRHTVGLLVECGVRGRRSGGVAAVDVRGEQLSDLLRQRHALDDLVEVPAISATMTASGELDAASVEAIYSG